MFTTYTICRIGFTECYNSNILKDNKKTTHVVQLAMYASEM